MDHRHVAGTLAAVGAVLAASLVWHIRAELSSANPIHLIGDAVLVGGAAAGLLYGAYWHWVRELPEERYPRILGWIVTVAVLFVSTTIVSLAVGSRHITPAELFDAVYLSASVGLVAGTVSGSHEALAISRAETAASNRARAEVMEAEQERFEELNRLLRHYVLNGVSVIDGYVDQLREVVPESEHDKLDAIEGRTETMTTLVEHVRTLSRVERDDEECRRVDLAAALEQATEHVEDIDVTMDDGLQVQAGETLDDGLSHLVAAVTEGSKTDGSPTVTCDRTGDRVTVTVATDGSLPERVEATMFEPVGAGIGLDLYLAKTLLDRFGDLRRVDADDEVRFELELSVDDGTDG